MAKRRLTLTDQESRSRLSRLKSLGIPIGSVASPLRDPGRLTLQQIAHERAALYELPSGAVGVVVPARMTVLTSGMLITYQEITTSLDEYPLDFSDPDEWPYHPAMIDTLCSERPLLNRYLTSSLPLRPCQVEGVIIANGWSVVPPQYHDNTTLRVKLVLEDERRNEIPFEFRVQLDRSLKRAYELKQARRREKMPPSGRGGGLFAPAAGPLGDPTSVAPEKAINPKTRRRTWRRTPEAKLADGNV